VLTRDTRGAKGAAGVSAETPAAFGAELGLPAFSNEMRLSSAYSGHPFPHGRGQPIGVNVRPEPPGDGLIAKGGPLVGDNGQRRDGG